MSHLIKMRQRIKAIEVIKKTTNAMRLISRSFHTKMSHEKGNLKVYQKEIETLLKKLYTFNSNFDSPFFFPKQSAHTKKLFIIVGAQKGLCGNYNTEVLYWIKNHTDLLLNAECMSVGKKTKDLLSSLHITPVHTFEELKAKTVSTLSLELIKILKNARPYYTEVTLIGSFPQTFFNHSLRTMQLIPAITHSPQETDEEYLWHNNAQAIMETLSEMCLTTKIHMALFDSLLGEQAARFIAMDNATRNANKFLDTMRLEYNKMRQAKITKELTELSAHFQS